MLRALKDNDLQLYISSGVQLSNVISTMLDYRAKAQAKLEHHRIEKQLAEMGNPESAKRIAGYMLEQDDSE